MVSVSTVRAPIALDPGPRRGGGRQNRHTLWRALRLLLLLASLGGLFLVWRGTLVKIELASDNPGLAFRSDNAGREPLRITVEGGGDVQATLAGVELADITRRGDLVLVGLPQGLPEGGYELEVAVDRALPFGRSAGRWAVVIDNQAPRLELSAPPPPVRLGDPVVVRGAVEPGLALRVADTSRTPFRLTQPTGDTFEITFERAPSARVELQVADASGNRTVVPVDVAVAYPASTRAAHITAVGWAADEVREPFLELVDRGVIDTVQLDIKDEAGIVGYDSQVPLARRIGAVEPSYDPKEALELLHGKGVRVIGRIVAFRDPVLATWAWEHGHRDWVLQDPDGKPFAAYGGFSNYAQRAVRDYNLDLAEEAAALGFDDILWDYVRRPEGDPAEMVVPGLTGTGRTTGDEIVEFLAEGRERLRPLGVYHGASVFGIAATRPENIGQPIDRIATVVDYVAPMVYPSHYVNGECGVARPSRQPYDIVRCSLQDFVDVMKGTPAVLVPWLQDFSIDGVAYGPDEVRAQVDAAFDAGSVGFLLWNPAASYAYEG